MPSKYTQDNRPVRLTTILGKDELLLTHFSGVESISAPYYFNIDCLAETRSAIPFDAMIGSKLRVDLELPDKRSRFFSGICRRIRQMEENQDFSRFSLEMVPTVWLLTKRSQSRIFQHKTIPDILKEVFKGMDVVYTIQGTFEPRDYCVQYRESDFNFASRLMEEEGIYYYFRHKADGETMIVANTTGGHEALPFKQELLYASSQASGKAGDDFISSLAKSQEIISGKFTLFDHCFELPHKHLEAEKLTEKNLNVGMVAHKIGSISVSKSLENYDYPGAYAQRFDGISKGGGEQPKEITKIFEDNKRTVAIRAQQESVTAIRLDGTSTCRQLSSGFQFTLKSLPGDQSIQPVKADGKYVLTSVQHLMSSNTNFHSSEGSSFQYKNQFTCIPLDLPFRPQQNAYIPVVYGSQTAVVVGPPGEEIFTDKYGRVKVQFHWDRQGKNDADSSCWIRVGTQWAGKKWGMIHIPRIGQEVIVDFLEGDPDQPIIVGSVYNADQMPHYKLPDERTKSYLKSNTSPGGIGFNEIRLEDKKGKEQIFIHAERNADIRVKNNRMDTTVGHQHLTVGTTKDGKHNGSMFEQISEDRHIKVEKDQEEAIEGGYRLAVGKEKGENGSMNIQIEKDNIWLVRKENHLKVLESQFVNIDKQSHLTVKNDYKIDVEYLHTTVKELSYEKIGQSKVVNAGNSVLVDATKDVYLGGGGEIHIKAGSTVIIEAGAQISLKVGGNFVDISAASVAINGTTVMINSGGAAGSGSGSKGVDPEPPTIAKTASRAQPKKPELADNSTTGQKSAPQ